MGSFSIGAATLACPAFPAGGRFSGSSTREPSLKPIFSNAARNGLLAAGGLSACIAGLGAYRWSRGRAVAARIQGQTSERVHRFSLVAAESLASHGRNQLAFGGLLLAGAVLLGFLSSKVERRN